jgi:excisionase family DNA binding protein
VCATLAALQTADDGRIDPHAFGDPCCLAEASKLVGRSRAVVVTDHEMPEPANQPISARGDLLTAEEVAALLRVTPAWVYAETRRHRIPHIRLGRYVRYRGDALALWMDQLEDRSGTAAGHRSRPRPNGGGRPSRPT